MRRVLSLIIAALMLLSLSGCGLDAPREDVNITDDTAKVTEPVAEDVVPESEPDSKAESKAESEAEVEPESEVTPIYDTSAILEAHRSGDVSPLSEKDKTIYEAAISAISEFYADGMSDVDVVIAAHDWIVTNTTYDAGMLLAIPNKTDETENPYGALILHQGICMGYTTTFQLFMDMLGVESQIIRGTGFGGGEWEEHAWNLVCIDGEYYHVDTTWDDFIPDEDGRPAFHIYCMVPDYVMEKSHIWDRDAVPSATSEDMIYYKLHGLFAGSCSDSELVQSTAHENGQRYCEIMTPSSDEVTFNEVAFYWTTDFDNYVVTIYWME